ncbi:MAG: hypothetical protein HYZ27_01265 [Deltaproteobacteria bacterium]|nr:hypothetical protein [Deltaproteobacteria bacterium]
MRLRWLWLGVALLSPWSALAEPVGSLRLLLHGRRMLADTGVGLAAWVLAPNGRNPG